MEPGRIYETLKRNVLEVVPEVAPDAISMSSSLADLGCNSIDRADILTMTMEQLGIVVPIHEFGRGQTVEHVVALLQRHA